MIWAWRGKYFQTKCSLSRLRHPSQSLDRSCIFRFCNHKKEPPLHRLQYPRPIYELMNLMKVKPVFPCQSPCSVLSRTMRMIPDKGTIRWSSVRVIHVRSRHFRSAFQYFLLLNIWHYHILIFFSKPRKKMVWEIFESANHGSKVWLRAPGRRSVWHLLGIVHVGVKRLGPAPRFSLKSG
jgi:hypothetical protein